MTLLNVINNQIFDKFRSRALKLIDEHVANVTGELDAVEAGADLRNQCLYPLQTLRDQVEEQASVVHIFATQTEAGDVVDAALEKIEKDTKSGVGITEGGVSPM